jgi:hypothetical protein
MLVRFSKSSTTIWYIEAQIELIGAICNQNYFIMEKVYTYDEKADYDQRYRYRQNKHAYSSPDSSNSSSTSCNDENCEDCNSNTRPYSYPVQNTADGKRSSCIHGERERKVRFMVEQPLAPGWVANWNWDVAQKRGTRKSERRQEKERERREKEDAWWANGGQGLVPDDSDEEDEDEDVHLDKEKEEP